MEAKDNMTCVSGLVAINYRNEPNAQSTLLILTFWFIVGLSRFIYGFDTVKSLGVLQAAEQKTRFEVIWIKNDS